MPLPLLAHTQAKVNVVVEGISIIFALIKKVCKGDIDNCKVTNNVGLCLVSEQYALCLSSKMETLFFLYLVSLEHLTLGTWKFHTPPNTYQAH